MGLFKKVKKLASSKLGKIALTAAATYFAGPAGLGFGTLGQAAAGGAASMLLGGGAAKQKAPSPTAMPASPMAALPVFADFETRPQSALQTAEGGDVASSDLLGDAEDDEVKKRRAARTLLG